MSRLLFIGLVNFLIALFVLFSPIAATADDDLHRLVVMVNKFGAEVMPSLQALRKHPEHPHNGWHRWTKGGPMRTLGPLVDNLENVFVSVQNASKGHESAAVWAHAHFGAIKSIVYKDLVDLRHEWYGIENPNAQCFTQDPKVNPKAGHAKLNAHLMNQLEILKKELESHKQYDGSIAQLPEKMDKKIDSTRRALQLAFDCVDTLNIMYENMANVIKTVNENMPSIAGPHASMSVSEEELHWALSTLAVNLWAYAAMGTLWRQFVIPGVEEAAKTAEQAHPIAFKMPKGYGVEKAESDMTIKQQADENHSLKRAVVENANFKHKRQRVENAGAPAVQNVAGGVSGKSAAENNDDMMEWE